jgi:hypothetical protein
VLLLLIALEEEEEENGALCPAATKMRRWRRQEMQKWR